MLLSVKTVIENVVQPLFGTVLEDYKSNVPEAREPKVLSLLSITIFSLKVKLLIGYEQTQATI